MLAGKTIVLGVTGSIAAYKIANLASMLVKQHADVHVIMTKNACQFITPMTFETLTENKCIVDTFDRNFSFDVKHVSLAKAADLILIAPCTANVIGKIAGGICDDMLTTTVMATKAPVIISPAMNTGMWENPILQDNIKKLESYGYTIVEPASGRLACGDIGSGKMPSEEILMQHIMLQVAKDKDFAGKKILITAGPTQEAIDPVRYITNHSSGKMGYALAKMAALRGAEVSLISGPVAIEPYMGVHLVNVTSAEDMYNVVTTHYEYFDIIIACAAVADYTPAEYKDQKIKKYDVTVTAVSFSDDTIWRNDSTCPYTKLPEAKAQTIQGELLEQLKRELSGKGLKNSASYSPQKAMGLWQCGCGSWQLEGETCLKCKASWSLLLEKSDTAILEGHLSE